MAALPPASERRRPRRGSVERPVNGRLYRGTWLIVGLPLLVLAFSVARPAPLPSANLPPAFDKNIAATIARDLALHVPSRVTGTPGATIAERWLTRQLAPFGYDVRSEATVVHVAGRGPVRVVNLVAEKRGLSHKTIVVMAHRDDDGAGSGANDNASGTGALVELARAYAPAGGTSRVTLPYTLLFLSTDGALDGAAGAAAFAESAPERQDVVGVIDLDSIAGPAVPRLVVTGDTARSPSASLVETLRTKLALEVGVEPHRASAVRQLIDLAFPFSLYEQAPFITRGIPAVTITTLPDRRPAGFAIASERLSIARIGEVGRAVQDTIDAMEQGVALSPGPSSYIYLGGRIVRGWAIEIVLVAGLLPFLTTAVDLFARCRRRRIRVAPAVRALRSRLLFWAWCGALFAVIGAFGAWPGGAARPPSLENVKWPVGGIITLAVLAAIGWLVARHRLLPRRPVRAEEELAGHAAALLALGAIGLVTVATNPYALILLLPSLHAWLWLPQVRGRSIALRAAVLIAGFLGPALLLWSFATRYGLGFDAPWYVAWLFAIRYAPLPLAVIALAWAAAAGQLAALSAGRYAPYPGGTERPPLGPIRSVVRTVVLAQRRRRRGTRPPLRALEG